MTKMKLFCLPYAGGSAVMYKKMEKYLHPSIELIPIEYAGRGIRFNAPLYNSINEVVNDVYSIIKNDLNKVPYAFLGHSMGSLIAYELSHKISQTNHKNPIHIFFSGSASPNTREKKFLHTLNNEKFKEELLKLQGTPKEILESEELMDIFFPILRSDFKIISEYKYVEKKDKLDCNFKILYGKYDNIELSGIMDWKTHTKKNCEFFEFQGGHFFINDYLNQVVKIINDTLVNERLC